MSKNSSTVNLKILELEIPKDISKEQVVEAFCQYVKTDYYEWLEDNFESFFDHGNPDWKWISEKIRLIKKEY